MQKQSLQLRRLLVESRTFFRFIRSTKRELKLSHILLSSLVISRELHIKMSQATMDKVAQGQGSAVNEEDSANKPIKSNTFSCDCAILYELSAFLPFFLLYFHHLHPGCFTNCIFYRFGNTSGPIIASGASLALSTKLTAKLYSFKRADTNS